MRRARHPTPIQLASMKYDATIGLYIISEHGITYHLTQEHTRLLKTYFRGKPQDSSIEQWFEKLDNTTKKEVKREGNQDQG
jgi:hypothetical protein